MTEPPTTKQPTPQDTTMAPELESTTVNEKKKNDPKQMMQQIKDAGLAGALYLSSMRRHAHKNYWKGVISYALWELGFWTISVPLTLIGYQRVTGHWPDLSDKEDIAKLSAEAFAFVNFARFAVPLRIGTYIQKFIGIEWST